MQLGMIGLGRMGSNMVKRLMKAGHECAVFDLNPATVKGMAEEGAKGATEVADFKNLLKAPRAIWVMVPSGDATEGMVKNLIHTLESGDIIIDGGNSYYKDDVRRAKMAAEKGIHYVDAGTSGGVWGFERGYCLAKMVHNGIEYGVMQAYAEGFDILKNANSEALEADHRYNINLPDLAETWRRGSVIGSWLLDLTAMALIEDPELARYTGFVQDSGEGRWTIQAAIEEAVPAEVLTAALFARFRSRQEHTFAEKMLSAMRNKFGGHVELHAAKS
jgi:6-phosphogluconate dehydrogenase